MFAFQFDLQVRARTNAVVRSLTIGAPPFAAKWMNPPTEATPRLGIIDKMKQPVTIAQGRPQGRPIRPDIGVTIESRGEAADVTMQHMVDGGLVPKIGAVV